MAPILSTYGNLQTKVRSFDQDGRIASYTLGVETKQLSLDAASRITAIQTLGNPASALSFGYDALDRLTNATLPYTSYTYGYDAVGNRTSRSVSGSADSYVYPPTSNRLASISPSSGPQRTITQDLNGSITADGINQYGYDARGRLVSSNSVAGTTSYQVNALGQRVRKTNAPNDKVFVYDRNGRLIAESTAAGQIEREYVYLDDMPVAVVQ